jgi:Predicted pyridoxal phosphate-dependent enzyme apparently involved in regulation of cell wall biogenesis
LHIPFNRPLAVGDEIDYIRAAIARPKFCFTASCVLRAQLEHLEQIQSARRRLWENYMRKLGGPATDSGVRLPTIPLECEQSYHMFYLILPSLDRRQGLIWHLSRREIFAVFHSSSAASFPDGALLRAPGRLSCHRRLGGSPAASSIFHRDE